MTRLAAALAPLEKLGGEAVAASSELAARHRDVLAALSRTKATKPPSSAPTARSLPRRSTNSRRVMPLPDSPVACSDYVELFAAALAGRVVRRPPRPGLRVRILGLLEARLTESDRVVLGGLVEGTWPPESRTDAWLSRPMRLDLGLDLPERRIGLTAHDFAQLLGARDVILTLAGKDRRHADGAVALYPAACRRRRRALADSRSARGENYLGLGARTRPARRGRAGAAARRQRRRARRGRKGFRSPRSSIGCAIPIRSMPSIFCGCGRSIAVDVAPGAAERGTFIHAAIGEFTQKFARSLPPDPVGELHRARPKAFCRASRIFRRRERSGGRASSASRAGSRAGKSNAAPRIAAIAAEIRGEIEIPLDRRQLPAARHRRPHRAPRRRQLCDPRLQDRLGANRQAGAHRACAAASAGSRDPAQRRISREFPPAPRSPRSSTCC